MTLRRTTTETVRYYIDGRRVSRARFWEIRDSTRQDSFVTKVLPHRVGFKVVQLCEAR